MTVNEPFDNHPIQHVVRMVLVPAVQAVIRTRRSSGYESVAEL
jgi:hypothetical protein